MSQSRILRCFVKPAGVQWLDLPLASNQSVQQVFAVMKSEGALVSDHFILPAESILYAGVIVFEDGRPTLSVVPGPWGKPTDDKPDGSPPNTPTG